MKPATAATPSDLSPRDLELVLALVRGHTLQEAGRRLGLDTSSVYRAVKKLEQRLGLPLFDRGRQGMAPGELALALAQRAEAIEAQLESARELLQDDTVALSGSLRVSCNDIGLHGLLLPLIGPFVRAHPLLQIELLATNQLARLDRREADIALRGTTTPPEHLVGVKLGVMRSALWASQAYLDTLPTGTGIAAMAWATPDADVNLPDYPSRRWRQARYPDLVPRLRCDGMLAVARAVQTGVAVGVAPNFLMAGQPGLVDLTGHLPEVDVDLWLLTHADMRHLRRVKAFFDFVRRELVLP
jgi:DNA-binding transcriptional LysR family regulator